jgi:hypothetical protein
MRRETPPLDAGTLATTRPSSETRQRVTWSAPTDVQRSVTRRPAW